MKNYQLTDEQMEVLRFCAAIPTGLIEVLDWDNIPEPEQKEILHDESIAREIIKEIDDNKTLLPLNDEKRIFLLKYMQAYKNSVEKYNPESNEEDFARIKELVIINELKSIVK